MAEKRFKTPVTVAVVDDDPETLRTINIMLTMAGARVVESGTGIGGFLLVKREKPQVVLLDIMMPDLDGFEVCRKLKLNPGTKDIPILFVTARSGQEHIDRGLSLGAQGCIAKPFTPDELITKISEVTGVSV